MKKIQVFLYVISLSLILSLFTTRTQAALPPDIAASNGFSNMLEGVMTGVVNIAAQGEIPQIENPLAEPNNSPQRAPLPKTRQFESLGSGVIMDAKNGFIITNAHVLRDAKTITVTLSDGRLFKAKLLGMDPASDIALLQIKADKLTALNLGNSDELKVGDFVAAIGTPFGLSQTVTSGIISGLQRSNLGIEGYENFIQTDASINPGNSGGALVNMKGQLIGINTAILAPGGGNIGIGFAIPINMARGVMYQLVKYGSVQRGLMGVIIQDLTPALADAMHLSSDMSGALVAQVSPNSPAAAAGIQVGDIIEKINDQIIKNASQLKNTVGLLRAGSRIDLQILRKGKVIRSTLSIMDPRQLSQIIETRNPFLTGVTLQNFNQEVALQGHVVGVQVLNISENSMLWHAGIRPGDVIVSANQTPISDFSQLQQIARQSKEQLLLNVLKRGGGATFVVIK